LEWQLYLTLLFLFRFRSDRVSYKYTIVKAIAYLISASSLCLSCCLVNIPIRIMASKSLFCTALYEYILYTILFNISDPSGRAIKGINCLRSLECRDRGFESHSRLCCLYRARLFCVSVLLFVGRCPESGWFPVQGVLPVMYRIKKLKKRSRSNRGLWSHNDNNNNNNNNNNNLTLNIRNSELYVHGGLWNKLNYESHMGHKVLLLCKIWGFHGGDYDDYHLLGDDNHYCCYVPMNLNRILYTQIHWTSES
jgi:hypothetical protein